MSGCLLFRFHGKVSNAVVYLHCIVLIVFGCLQYCNSAGDVGVNHKSPVIIILMMFIWNFLFITNSLLFIVVFWKSKKPILSILEESSRFLGKTDHTTLFRVSLGLLIFKVLYVVFVRGFGMYLTLKSEGLGYLRLMLIYFHVHDWCLSSISLYLVILQVNHLAERNVITQLEVSVTTDNDLSFARKAYAQLQKTIAVKEKISESISILPFMLFLYAFVQSICCICRFQATYFDNRVSLEGKTYAVMSLVKLFVLILQISIMTFFIHKMTKESRKNLSLLAAKIAHTQDPSISSFVLNIIKECQSYEHQALDFFPINRGLLLSFGSSFVSLTVLFVQLINQAKSLTERNPSNNNNPCHN